MGNLAAERFQTGNHCRVFLTGDDAKKILADGVIGGPIGKGQSTNFATSTGARPVHIIGDPDPVEIVDTQHTYTVRVDMLRLRAEEAAQLIQAGPVDIEVVDRFNNKLVAVAQGCKLAEGNLSIPANQMVARNLTFQALRING